MTSSAVFFIWTIAISNGIGAIMSFFEDEPDPFAFVINGVISVWALTIVI